ncbi:MAG: beta-glucuronidase [Solirubrobacteraceae bacterium]|nr:beta-glucuronidase [Solirubrobacteraceae bacterium]
MRRLSLLLLATLALTAHAAAAGAAATPAVKDGLDGRTLLGGKWSFSAARSGPYKTVAVPYAWNAGDDSPASMSGGTGWYRKRFTLPRADKALGWRVHFDGVNYRAKVYLNGHLIGRHAGAYLPWELPLDRVKRRGTNTLEVRVDSRRLPTDFPPSRISVDGVPSGGWFTSSGIIREVTLRAVRGVDLEAVQVRPELPCAACRASVRVQLDLHGVDHTARTLRVSGTFGGQAIPARTVQLPAGARRRVVTRLTVRKPKLWSPASPALYPVRISVRAGATELAGWSGHSGIRSIEVKSGHLYFNGKPTALRGVGYHEEVRGRGMALTHADRVWLVDEAKALGATMIRTHYPPGQDLLELADRRGLLVWSEIPVYSMKASYLAIPAVRQAALDTLASNITVNGNHPSVAVWSIGNELSPQVGPAVGGYVARASALVHALDPTRPVALAINGYPSALCQTRYGPLDLIGINDYFGWYPGPSGELFDRTRLTDYLDAVRACYPKQALMVTEFGAEANRDGPVEEKGTWSFQQDFVDYHLGVFATKPWLSGALYWALNEFRVRPAWAGGNPRPAPPVHQKGLITYDTHARKPAWENVHRWYTGQVPGEPAVYPSP